MDSSIDGAEALRAIAEAIRGARRSVRIAGWHTAPTSRSSARSRRRCCASCWPRSAARGVAVRVLLWAGAPFRAFKPARADVRAEARELVHGTGVRVALDDRERLLHCHHEKLVVVDDEVAFVGGIDLTDLGGDRWDTPAASRPGAARLARRRLAAARPDRRRRRRAPRPALDRGDRRAAAGGAGPARAGDITVQLLRTIPEHVYDRMRDGAFGILEGYMRALHAARELIYLESQFFWLPEIVHLLSDKLRDPPSDRFRVVVLLPSKPNNGEEDTRGMLAHLADADPGRGRFLATTIDAMTGSTVDQLYVHAKIGIVDDRWLTIGSANLNATRSSTTPRSTSSSRPGARARHAAAPLERAPRASREDEVAGDPADVVDRLWIRSRGASARAGARGSAASTGCASSRPSSRKLERLLGPMDAIVVDG